MPSPATPTLLHLSPPLSSPTQKSTWYPYSNGTDFDSNVAMILIILICALICALAINAAIRFILRHSRPHGLPVTDPHSHKTTHAAPATTVISPPTLVFSEGMKLAEAECAICLSEFVNGDGVRVLPRCKHGFHAQCIEGWLSSHTSCPTCRTTTACLTPSPPQPEPAIQSRD